MAASAAGSSFGRAGIDRLNTLCAVSRFVTSSGGYPGGVNFVHQLTAEADDGLDVLFVCPVEGCGRRVVVRRSGELIVLDKGDFYALHVGGTNGLEISSVVPENRQASA